MERIYECIYVHLETILGFTKNKQIGCLEAFRGNANGVNHPRNVTSHVGSPRNVSGEYMIRSGEVQIRKLPKLKVTHSVRKYSSHLLRHIVLDDKLLFGYQLLFY